MCCLPGNITRESDLQNWGHPELKQLKQSEAPAVISSDDGRLFNITWKKAENQFTVEDRKSFCDSITSLCSCKFGTSDLEARLMNKADSLATALNNIDRADRSGRRADYYPLRAGDLSSLVTGNSSTITVAYERKEEALPPTGNLNNSFSSSSRAVSRPLVLLYGFEENRKDVRDDLVNKFGAHQNYSFATIDDYNNGIQNFPTTFSSYCDFFVLGRAQQLKTQAPNRYLSSSQVQPWATHLQNNSGKFDFSRKVGTDQKRLEFVIKNCKKEDFSPALQGDIDSQNWSGLMQKLRPALDLLSRVNEPGDLSALKDAYALLSPDQKKILDTVVINALFRQTSKLGLTFARNAGASILFAWQAQEGVGSLDSLHSLLEAKPYKGKNPQFQGTGKDQFEFFTYSEMRELGRLQQRQALAPTQNIVPDHLLITKIDDKNLLQPDPLTLKAFASLSSVPKH